MIKRNEKIINIIYKAAKILEGTEKGCPREQIHEKGGTFNYVTEYDVKVQSFLEAELSALVPGAHFFAEEDDENERVLSDGYTFIIDPIDGTSNFIHGMGNSAISVALFKDKEAEFGAVYLPYTREMFYAEKGGGAFCNGEPIRVSELELNQALSIFGTSPYMRDTMSGAVTELMHGLLIRSVDVRRFGAAAADLCHVACGRAAAFCEMYLSPWDYAAGNLILTEAGGIVTRFDGSPVSYTQKSSILASNKKAYAEVYAVCREIAEKYIVK